jgi:hypothetical protein
MEIGQQKTVLSGQKKRYQKAGQIDFNKVFSYREGNLYWAKKASDKVVVGNLAGWVKGNGYRLVSVNKIILPVHHVVWHMFNGSFIDENLDLDHINGDRLDNHIENLRAVTRSDNLMNKSGYGKTSPYRGVYKLPSGKFCVKFRRDYLGSYDTEEEAAEVWNKHALKFSSYTRLNGVT